MSDNLGKKSKVLVNGIFDALLEKFRDPTVSAKERGEAFVWLKGHVSEHTEALAHLSDMSIDSFVAFPKGVAARVVGGLEVTWRGPEEELPEVLRREADRIVIDDGVADPHVIKDRFRTPKSKVVPWKGVS